MRLSKHIEINPSPGDDHVASGIVASVTVDVNSVGVGAPLFVAADGNYEQADADNAGDFPVTALAIESGIGTKTVLLFGYFRDDSWTWTPGGAVYVSTTDGTLTQSPPGAGTYVQRVGIAISADVILFSPSLDVVKL